jgi:hypothetical protein
VVKIKLYGTGVNFDYSAAPDARVHRTRSGYTYEQISTAPTDMTQRSATNCEGNLTLLNIGHQ